MKNNIINQNLNNLDSKDFNWNLIQNEMKNKLGIDIYESWLKKIDFIEEHHNYLLRGYRSPE